jgi:hypothetical protein
VAEGRSQRPLRPAHDPRHLDALSRESCIRERYSVTQRRACRLVQLHRSVFYCRSRLNPRLELRGHMRELARSRVRFGYRRLHVLLRREGFAVSKGGRTDSTAKRACSCAASSRGGGRWW